MCGSRDWPRLNTDCPQCYGEPEDTGYDDADDEREPYEPLDDFPE